MNASFGESEAATFDSMKSENGAMDKHLIIENAVFYRVFFGVDDPTCTFFHRIYYRVICILFCEKVQLREVGFLSVLGCPWYLVTGL